MLMKTVLQSPTALLGRHKCSVRLDHEALTAALGPENSVFLWTITIIIYCCAEQSPPAAQSWTASSDMKGTLVL